MREITNVAASLGLALLLTGAAGAADGIWQAAEGGLWSDGANWQGGEVASGAGAVAFLPDLAYSVAISNDLATLKLKGLALQGGAYLLCGQSLTLEGALTGDYGLVANGGSHLLELPLAFNANSRVLVAQGAELATAGLHTYLGNYTVTKTGAGEWRFAGSMAVTNGSTYLDISGGSMRLMPGTVLTKRGGNRNNLRIGNVTPGRLIVGPGSTLNAGAFVLGEGDLDNMLGQGYLLVDGGALTADSADFSGTLIGRYAASQLCVSNNGTANFSRMLNLGAWGRGELHIGSDSGVEVGELSLGVTEFKQAGINGGALATIGGGGSLKVTSILFWSSSGDAGRSNRIVVGDGVAGSATLEIPATTGVGPLEIETQLLVNGGVLRLIGLRNNAYTQSTADYLYGLHDFYIGRAGAVVDTSGQDATLTQLLQTDPAATADGGLIKAGAGTLTLAGGVTYVGATIVDAGELRLQGVLPNGAVMVEPGATLSLVDGQIRTLAPDAFTAGLDGLSVIALEAAAGGQCDSLALPAGAYLEQVAFKLMASGGASSWWLPGEYVVASYSGQRRRSLAGACWHRRGLQALSSCVRPCSKWCCA